MIIQEKQYITCKDTAKIVREALKRHFPDYKFSIRSKTYSGGASIDISWEDGLTHHEVDKIVKRYEGASFDGMIDLKSYHSTLLADKEGNIKEVHFGADYIFTNRHISKEIHTQAEKDLCEYYQVAYEGENTKMPERLFPAVSYYVCQEAERILQKVDLTKGYNKELLREAIQKPY